MRNWKLFGHPSLTLAWLVMSDGFYLCMSAFQEQEEIFRDKHKTGKKPTDQNSENCETIGKAKFVFILLVFTWV